MLAIRHQPSRLVLCRMLTQCRERRDGTHVLGIVAVIAILALGARMNSPTAAAVSAAAAATARRRFGADVIAFSTGSRRRRAAVAPPLVISSTSIAFAAADAAGAHNRIAAFVASASSSSAAAAVGTDEYEGRGRHPLTRTAIRRMRVTELREELAQRGIADLSGRREDLAGRLLDAAVLNGGGGVEGGGVDGGDIEGGEPQEGGRESCGASPAMEPEAPGISGEGRQRRLPAVSPDRTFILRFGGTSRGGDPPGPAGAAAVLLDAITGVEVWSGRRYLGSGMATVSSGNGCRGATVNEAEYVGLLLGLRAARHLGADRIVVEGDSGRIVVRQVGGTQGVRSANLRPLYAEAERLLGLFKEWEMQVVPREVIDQRARELATLAMDARASADIDFLNEEAGEKNLDGSGLHSECSSLLHDGKKTVHENQDRPLTTGSPSSPISPQSTYILRFDGGSRGNPGPAGAGMVLLDAVTLEEIWSAHRFLGERSTNNEAEYAALVTGLRSAVELGVSNVIVEGDSQLIIRQLEGTYRVKSDRLRPLYEEARGLLGSFGGSAQVRHIPRAENRRADELANRAMDERSTVGCDLF